MRPPEVIVAITALAAALAMMVAELKRSRRNERELRHGGAVEPEGDVYRAMAFVYPAVFVVMAIEGALFGPATNPILFAGFVVFIGAKLLKLWAIAALGSRWSFRVLVLPGIALVSSGPYAYLRHPNYVAVLGEIGGFAMIVGAPVTGIVSLLVFGALVRRRIAIEEKALGLNAGSRLKA